MRALLSAVCLTLASGVAAGAQTVTFGVNTKFDQGLSGPAMIDRIIDAGVAVNRDSLNWQRIEIDRNRYVWNAPLQRLYATLAEKGIRSNLILTISNPLYDGGRFPTSPDAVAAFARFAAYAARQLRGRVVAFEIGNEFRPTPGMSGKTNFADYVRLFVAAANAIHATDPSARVVADPAIFANRPATKIPAPGTPIGDAARAALHVADGVVVHQYPYQMRSASFAQAQATMVTAMERRAAWLEAIAGRPVPLYVTEYGWPRIAARGLTPAVQAAQLAQTTRALAAMPFVRLAIAYELADSCKQEDNVECSFGLYRRGTEGLIAQPALTAFRNAVRAK